MVPSVASVWFPNIFITRKKTPNPLISSAPPARLRSPGQPSAAALPWWISLFWTFPTNGPTVWNLCVWLLTRSVVFRALRVVAGVQTSRMSLSGLPGQADRVSIPTRLAMDSGLFLWPLSAALPRALVYGYLFEDLFLSLWGITVSCGYSVFNC